MNIEVSEAWESLEDSMYLYSFQEYQKAIYPYSQITRSALTLGL